MKNVMSENSFCGGGFSFDFSKGVFSVRGRTAELDRDEAKILRILTDNPGITIEDDILICKIWYNTDFVNKNILDEKIKSLISKISAEDFIVSDGTGYKWRKL